MVVVEGVRMAQTVRDNEEGTDDEDIEEKSGGKKDVIEEDANRKGEDEEAEVSWVNKIAMYTCVAVMVSFSAPQNHCIGRNSTGAFASTSYTKTVPTLFFSVHLPRSGCLSSFASSLLPQAALDSPSLSRHAQAAPSS